MEETEQTDDGKFSQWRIFGIVFGGVIVFLVAGYLLLLRLDYQTLYSGLPIEDAALVAAELDRQDIRYRVADGGGSITVPTRHINDIRLALYSADGPTRGLSGFELFNESEMGLTDFAQKIKFQRAIQGELARTIMMIDSVSRARVHIAIPERSVFRSRVVPTKAAVTLIAREEGVFDDAMILGVQRLVASSVPNLSLQNVTVLDGEGWIISKMSTVFDMKPNDESGLWSPVSMQKSTPVAATLQAGLSSQSVSPPSINQTEMAILETDRDELLSDHALDFSEKFAETQTEPKPRKNYGAIASFDTPYSLDEAVRSGSQTSRASTILDIHSGWMWWALAIFLVLVSAVASWVFRRRDYLDRDECKAFADELSEMLPDFDAELRHG